MRINWKRLVSGALLIASLSLILFGCSDMGSAPEAKAPTKAIGGVVSNPDTGLPLPGVTVTAYAVVGGVTATTPLSTPASTTTNVNGKYTLYIPENFAGTVAVEASLSGASKVAAKSGKQVSLSSVRRIRAFLPNIKKEQLILPPVMISLATEMVALYVEQNKSGHFTPVNIQTAISVLEMFFGANFTEIPPPSSTGSIVSRAQQDLTVMIRAISQVVSSAGDVATLIVVDSSNMIGLGGKASEINAAINAARTELVASGVLPTAYATTALTTTVTQSATTQVSETLADSVPSAPTGLSGSADSTTATLTWNLVAGASSYLIYRDGVYINSIVPSESPTTTIGYTDTSLASSTEYTYEVKAHNSAGNSASAPVKLTTLPAAKTYTVSGVVTFADGSKIPGVKVTLTGDATGTTTTDAAGAYSFTVKNGTYTITPLLTSLNPASIQVAVANGNKSGQDFISTLTGGGVTTVITNPDGSVTTTTTYPNGTVSVSTTYPNGTVSVSTTYPNGTISVSTTYPNGTISVSTTYPDGSVTTSTTYPNGSVTTSTTYPNGTVISTITYSDGSVITTTTYPNGSVTTTTTYPNGSISGSLVDGYLVSGTVVDNSNAALLGVTVTITDGSYTATAVTGPFGTYTFRGVPAGSYSITPVLAPYTFVMATGITVSTSNVTGQNFTAGP
ncbi:carboxypeptidase regulatory-like domain-containing protein [Geobacter sp. SVR]|uniref:carboxypeptidase regulatory-like domain-containing protein n=1 Tax=Geobacter sp. SVR TaxID=2495594 RepID=UPI00143EF9AF|nr:carboxypeptidase regulatory-like domain-containing protein [Geobacter sp. SVR]BCS52102.1 hypothetical protein GSVR_04100 [Geobacter sp. SVR]GCF86557.1 hypothetical protein GSbR_31570 [Geobacter sp. SVR]